MDAEVALAAAAFWDTKAAAAELLEAVAEDELLPAWVVAVAASVDAEVALAAAAFWDTKAAAAELAESVTDVPIWESDDDAEVALAAAA